MLDKLTVKHILNMDWKGAIPVLRYAIGSTLILAVATGSGYTLSFVTPVLALGFLAPGAKPLSIKSGIGFVFTLALASFIGLVFGRLFLGFPLVFMPMLAIAMLHLYYSNKVNPLLKVWLIISLVLIPLLSTFSHKLGGTITLSLIANAAMAVALVWIIFFVFPFEKVVESEIVKTQATDLTDFARFKSAFRSLIVILPVLVMYFTFQWAGSILVMIFVVILSMNPEAANFKTGKFMIVANLAGGIAAIIAFNFFTVVPEFIFLILFTLIVGLYFGHHAFSNKPTAPLYGSAFSTYLLVLGSVTTSTEGDAGEKVWARIFQIGIAVIYVVIAFGLFNHFVQSRNSATEDE